MNRFSRRALAVVSAVALGVGALVAAAPAQAAPQPITSSSLDWGFKSSFKSYVNTFGGSITASEGATKTGSGFTWPGAGGTYDAATRVGTLNYAGKVTYRVAAHGIWNITLSNPSLVLDGDSTGTLLVDVTYATGGTEASPASSGTTQDVPFGDVTVGAPTVSGSTSTFTNQAVKLTAAGSQAFGGYYDAGTDLDALTAKASTGSTTPPVTPPAANPVGDLVTSLVASLQALLAGLGAR